MDLSGESFSPKQKRQLCFKEHSWNVICHGLISLLCYAVLLWLIVSGVAPMDPTCVCELDKGSRHVFPSLVILKLLHFHLEVILRKSLVCFECLKSVTFTFELHGSTVGGCIINEGHPIVIAFSHHNWERAMQIRMNQLEWLSCTWGRQWKRIGVHLACEAGLANNVQFCGGAKGHTCNQTFLVHPGDVCKIMVTTATMPEWKS